MFKVKHKVSKSVHEVYDITYSTNTRGEPVAFFLVYIGHKFQTVLASEFKPYENKKKKLLESNHKDKKYEYSFEVDI